MLHEFACHPCTGAMLIFSVSFQFQYMCCRSEHAQMFLSEHAQMFLILIKSNLLTSFVSCAFVVRCQVTVRSNAMRTSPMFSSKRFTVSALMFRSFIYFELVFVYGVRKGANFRHVNIQTSQHHLLKRLSFLFLIFFYVYIFLSSLLR